MSNWTQLRGHNYHFIRAHFNSEGSDYVMKISITDLTRLWGCSYSKDQTIEQAEKERCPIDPFETFDTLIEILSELLLNVSSESNAKLEETKSDESISLICNGKVTKDIQLSWKWSLRLQPAEAMSTMIWFPLTYHFLSSEIRSPAGSLFSIVQDRSQQLHDHSWIDRAAAERSAKSTPSTPKKRPAFVDLISPKRSRINYDFFE
ncbi:XRCC4-like nonhomologous end joining factor, Cernunnon Xlf1/Nej1 [Schizosaccharomyces osmophilus]|uniref:XRCC4-like nonhomologous end joining factor, Cernunnon Xlf1/Nej1 n=1 Tax=Schizosaccharomyces osmophilus TaxID=2545709 RepID=A0AAF0AZL9_9SCHI|nr:XRCC4-like nonhomologous end joining factor, Cernunnon Xlf1/Nej1 [Schizosaccharomyces osmophilus]WBW75228.1 XRCC4-like nonhomologous end joining factor, Cernunnon Xlf1/Nej1 [Schizosaccharomyces osmophilus]